MCVNDNTFCNNCDLIHNFLDFDHCFILYYISFIIVVVGVDIHYITGKCCVYAQASVPVFQQVTTTQKEPGHGSEHSCQSRPAAWQPVILHTASEQAGQGERVQQRLQYMFFSFFHVHLQFRNQTHTLMTFGVCLNSATDKSPFIINITVC